jgi:hypothetical protein
MEIFLEQKNSKEKKFVLYQYLLKTDYYVYYSEFDEPEEEKIYAQKIYELAD